MDFLEACIKKLQTQRTIFHSEDDLKLALALIIKENHPDFEIRLERPVELQMLTRNSEKRIVRAAIDILVIDQDKNIYPIELKFKTKKLEATINEEEFILTDQGAHDIGRYNFRKDIYRIENFKIRNFKFKHGYVLIVTNDVKYFEVNVFDKETIDKHFSIHNEAMINKVDLSWNYSKIDKNKFSLNEQNLWCTTESKKHWTCEKDLIYEMNLCRDYRIIWKEFSTINQTAFKYCLIKID